MGIKTVCWGPQAWIVYKGIVNLLDKYPSRKFESLLWYLFPKIQPCVHCRKSSEKFLKELKPSDFHLSQKVLLYKLHEKVNKKLFFQDLVHSKGNNKQLDKVLMKWTGYQPQLNEIIYPVCDSSAFFHALITYTYYMVSDFDSEREYYIQRYFTFIGEVLSFCKCKIGKSWLSALKKVSPPSHWDRQCDRIEYVFNIHVFISKQLKFNIPTSIQLQEQVCSNAIVGCKTKPMRK